MLLKYKKKQIPKSLSIQNTVGDWELLTSSSVGAMVPDPIAPALTVY